MILVRVASCQHFFLSPKDVLLKPLIGVEKTFLPGILSFAAWAGSCTPLCENLNFAMHLRSLSVLRAPRHDLRATSWQRACLCELLFPVMQTALPWAVSCCFST
jgi:hypothetical protein